MLTLIDNLKLPFIVSQHSKSSVGSKNLRSYPKLLLVVPGSIFHEHIPRFIAFMVVFFSEQQLVILTSNCSSRAQATYDQHITNGIALHVLSYWVIGRILESIMHQTPSFSFSNDKLEGLQRITWVHIMLLPDKCKRNDSTSIIRQNKIRKNGSRQYEY